MGVRRGSRALGHLKVKPLHAKQLRLLSYNIQVGIATGAYHQYLTGAWRHFIPHPGRLINLDRIAQLASEYDIVALQEVDMGSLRGQFVNQVGYLAEKAKFPFWHAQINRNLGRIAQYGNGLMSRFMPCEIDEHKLPGLIPGRGAMVVRYGQKEHALIIVVIHLALSRRARTLQFGYLSELIREYKHVIVMGDMNCRSASLMMADLVKETHLQEPLHGLNTFPSWRPIRNIDHILVSPSLQVNKAQVLKHTFSDHLPLAMDVAIPDEIHLVAA
jgi:endonuclease/exonuclease/phosphatase family metal-dependent hydrolase